MNLDKPKSWRKGQFLFNFLEWLRTEKSVPSNQSDRLADTFHISDEDFDKYYDEYIKLLKS